VTASWTPPAAWVCMGGVVDRVRVRVRVRLRVRAVALLVTFTI